MLTQIILIKKAISKNFAPFINCISEINNTQVDNAKDINIITSIYSLIEYSDNYSKTSRSLWQYCKYIAAIINNGDIIDFNGANVTDSFNFKDKNNWLDWLWLNKRHWNNSSIKIFSQFSENSWNPLK